MKNSLKILTLTAALALSSTAEARDPFAPAKASNMQPIINSAEVQVNPALAKQALSGMDLVGVITAKKDSIAILQTKNKRRIMARKGDAIGREGAVIEEIDVNGIKVKIGEEITHIDVHHELEVINE